MTIHGNGLEKLKGCDEARCKKIEPKLSPKSDLNVFFLFVAAFSNHDNKVDR